MSSGRSDLIQLKCVVKLTIEWIEWIASGWKEQSVNCQWAVCELGEESLQESVFFTHTTNSQVNQSQ